MAAIEDFETGLRSIVAAQRRPQPKLTRAEMAAIMDLAQPIFNSLEQEIEELRAAGGIDGPGWFGYDNEGNEYTGTQKKEVLHAWMEANEIKDETSLLRATLGEPKKDGPRARGPVTFYTYPSPTKGVAALWVSKGDDLALLRGMVSAIVVSSEEEEEE